MKTNINIAIVGLGQIGIYLYNQLKLKKKEIEKKTGKKIKIVGISAKNKNKKRRFPINKNIFYSNPFQIFKKEKVDILFECIGLSDGISKKIVETFEYCYVLVKLAHLKSNDGNSPTHFWCFTYANWRCR